MAARRDKSAGGTAEPQAPVLVPQPHGGALLTGGVPGNRGNPKAKGPPPSLVRQRLRGDFYKRRHILIEIADDAGNDAKDRLKAIDLMGRYGLGTTKELTVEHVQDRLKATLAVITDSLPPDQAEAIIQKLEEVWR